MPLVREQNNAAGT